MLALILRHQEYGRLHVRFPPPKRLCGWSANDPIADIADAWQVARMTDDDKARFDGKLRKMLKHKPVDKPE